MNKLERLAYWKTVAGDKSPSPWVSEEDDLFAYFQRFRPDGRGVERVFDEVYRGDEVLARLLPFYLHTKESAEHPYFVVRKPQTTTRQELLGFMKQYLDNVGQMAVAVDGWELVNVLASVDIEIKQGDA